MLYDTLSDQDLARLLQDGDPSAFQCLYNRYWDRLLVVAAKRLGDMLEAEEVVQDIFLNLWRRRETFELKVSFDHYLAVAVKFEVIDRRAKRIREDVLRSELATFPSYIPADASTFDLEYLQRQLGHTIQNLPPKCQLVFQMSRDDDFTNKQIAQALDISEKAVEKHISKALKVLRKRFGRYYFKMLRLGKGFFHFFKFMHFTGRVYPGFDGYTRKPGPYDLIRNRSFS